MILKSPGDIAFVLGSFDIHWYGIIMSLSILLGLIFILFLRKKYFDEISVDSILDLTFVLIICGLFAARLYYVALDYRYFVKYPIEIPAIWMGGISIQGAIIGGVIAGWFYTKKYSLNFLKYADLFSFGLVVGQIFGRFGNFFNSEAFGFPTNSFLKLYIPYSSRPLEYRMHEYFHPAFLYESLLNLFVLVVLLVLLSKLKNRKDGVIFFSYVILYSVVRIIVESIRIDSVLNVGCLHAAHITSLLFIILSVIAIYFILLTIKNNA